MLYNFTLKDNNQKAYNQFTWFLFFLHVIAASLVALNAVDKNVKMGMYLLLGFYALISFWFFFLRKQKKALETFSLILALLYANFWFISVGVLAVIIFVALYLFVAVVKGKKTNLVFSEKGVQLTRVFKTIIYPWPKMDNVILKDDLLTIDFKSNKIIQAEITEDSEMVDEKIFNLFCSEQLMQQV
jgi:predicted membrane protein